MLFGELRSLEGAAYSFESGVLYCGGVLPCCEVLSWGDGESCFDAGYDVVVLFREVDVCWRGDRACDAVFVQVAVGDDDERGCGVGGYWLAFRDVVGGADDVDEEKKFRSHVI